MIWFEMKWNEMKWYDLLASDMELEWEYENWEKTEMEWEVRIPFNTAW